MTLEEAMKLTAHLEGTFSSEFLEAYNSDPAVGIIRKQLSGASPIELAKFEQAVIHAAVAAVLFTQLAAREGGLTCI
jgi:hypothetical protein